MNAHRDDTPFGLGQPVWIRPEYFTDPRTFVVIGFHRGVFGGWMVEIVPENEISAEGEIFPVNYLTDVPQAMPRLHALHEGTIHFTSTGRALKCVEGGFPELRGKA